MRERLFPTGFATSHGTEGYWYWQFDFDQDRISFPAGCQNPGEQAKRAEAVRFGFSCIGMIEGIPLAYPTMGQHWQRLQFFSRQIFFLKGGLLFLILAGLILATGLPLVASSAWAATQPALSGKLTGPEWRQADPEAKQAFCRKAFQAFRASPAQSYIISSNVQALTPEGLCQRLDQFYQYAIHDEIPLNQAANIAPLLFSDQPLEQP